VGQKKKTVSVGKSVQIPKRKKRREGEGSGKKGQLQKGREIILGEERPARVEKRRLPKKEMSTTGTLLKASKKSNAKAKREKKKKKRKRTSESAPAGGT